MGSGGPDAEAIRVQGAVQLLMDCLADIVDHEGLDVLPAMSQASCNAAFTTAFLQTNLSWNPDDEFLRCRRKSAHVWRFPWLLSGLLHALSSTCKTGQQDAQLHVEC